MTDPRSFYDQLADAYHLIFDDWDGSINRQGEILARVLQRWPPEIGVVLDAAAGIGTQTLGIAARGVQMVGSDVSTRALQPHYVSDGCPTKTLKLTSLCDDAKQLEATRIVIQL